jgi:hypothetical protein
MNKTKILIVLATATCALAATTSTAYAKFHVEKYPVKIHGQNTNAHIFTTAGGVKFSCKTVHFNSEQQLFADTEQIKVTPLYTECESVKPVAGLLLTFTSNGCQYNLHQNGTVTIECPTGQSIKVKFPNGLGGTCEFTLPGQGPLSTIAYTNESGPPKTVNIRFSITSLSIGTVSSGCSGIYGAGEALSYEGAAKLEAQEDTSPFNQVGLEVV